MRRNNLLPKRFSGNNFTKYFLIDHHLSCHLTLSQGQTSDFCYYSLSEYQYFYISPGNLIAVPILKSQWLNTINVFLLHITVQSELAGSPPSSDSMTQAPSICGVSIFNIQPPSLPLEKKLLCMCSPEVLTSCPPHPTGQNTVNTQLTAWALGGRFSVFPGKQKRQVSESSGDLGHTVYNNPR